MKSFHAYMNGFTVTIHKDQILSIENDDVKIDFEYPTMNIDESAILPYQILPGDPNYEICEGLLSGIGRLAGYGVRGARMAAAPVVGAAKLAGRAAGAVADKAAQAYQYSKQKVGQAAQYTAKQMGTGYFDTQNRTAMSKALQNIQQQLMNGQPLTPQDVSIKLMGSDGAPKQFTVKVNP